MLIEKDTHGIQLPYDSPRSSVLSGFHAQSLVERLLDCLPLLTAQSSHAYMLLTSKTKFSHINCTHD